MLHLTQKDWETISAVLMLTRDYDESERQDFLKDDGSSRKQRWSREAYNAYQREYMRKRRAVASKV